MRLRAAKVNPHIQCRLTRAKAKWWCWLTINKINFVNCQAVTESYKFSFMKCKFRVWPCEVKPKFLNGFTASYQCQSSASWTSCVQVTWEGRSFPLGCVLVLWGGKLGTSKMFCFLLTTFKQEADSCFQFFMTVKSQGNRWHHYNKA